jgi:hypothetical protein
MTDGHTIHIHLEFYTHELARQHNPARTIAEASHHTATETAHQAGGHLRHPEPIEIRTSKAVDNYGNDLTLVSTAWIIDGATPPTTRNPDSRNVTSAHDRPRTRLHLPNGQRSS